MKTKMNTKFVYGIIQSDLIVFGAINERFSRIIFKELILNLLYNLLLSDMRYTLFTDRPPHISVLDPLQATLQLIATPNFP